MVFVINYRNGYVETIERDDVEEAMAYADRNATYTQHDLSVELPDGTMLMLRRWYGIEADADEKGVLRFGSFGHYGEWINCGEWG